MGDERANRVWWCWKADQRSGGGGTNRAEGLTGRQQLDEGLLARREKERAEKQVEGLPVE